MGAETATEGTGYGETLTVLHVDDDAEFLELTAEFLKSEDERMEVITEASVAAGLKRLEQRDIDCIVSDYEMPDTDGLEFLDAVRKRYPERPFILFTGNGSEEIASDAISAGVTDYLQKQRGAGQYTLLANRIRNAVGQRRAERRAERTRERFSRLLERSADFSVTVGADGTLEYATPSIEPVTGYPPEKLVDENVLEYVHPDDVEGIEERFDELLGGSDREASAEFRIEHEDGSWLWVEVRARDLLDDEVIGGVVLNVRDATERKRREQELERYRHRFEAVLEDPMTAVGLLDTDGTIEYANSRSLDYVDAELDDIVGRLLWEAPWWLDDDRKRVEEWVERAAGGEYVEYEVEHRHPSGASYTSAGTLRPVRNDAGEVESLIISARDISERKRRERELRAEREFIEEGLDTLDDVFYFVDVDGTLERWNEALSARTGYTDAEIAEMNAYDFFADDDRERVEATVTDALDRKTAVLEADLLTREGERIPHEFRGRLLTDDDGEPRGIVGIARDVTERQRRERELHRQNRRLERLASALSHDIQGPLAVATGRLELLDCEPEETEPIEESLSRIESLVDDVLTIAREGQTVDSTEAVDIERIAERCWNNTVTSDATLDVRTAATIDAGPTRFSRVLENLFSNAVEHGDADTVVVGELSDGLYIADDGDGIPEDRRERVLEWGYTTSASGTGFGLAIVEEIADAHGWNVEVTESTDGGARFEITGIETPPVS